MFQRNRTEDVQHLPRLGRRLANFKTGNQTVKLPVLDKRQLFNRYWRQLINYRFLNSSLSISIAVHDVKHISHRLTFFVLHARFCRIATAIFGVFLQELCTKNSQHSPNHEKTRNK